MNRDQTEAPNLKLCRSCYRPIFDDQLWLELHGIVSKLDLKHLEIVSFSQKGWTNAKVTWLFKQSNEETWHFT
jgi:hypothetical protein